MLRAVVGEDEGDIAVGPLARIEFVLCFGGADAEARHSCRDVRRNLGITIHQRLAVLLHEDELLAINGVPLDRGEVEPSLPAGAAEAINALDVDLSTAADKVPGLIAKIAW